MSDPPETGAFLWRAAHSWHRAAAAALRPQGIGYVEFLVLGGLEFESTPLTQVALARKLGVEPMTVSQVLRGLERRRLVRRQRSPRDSRAWAVAMTVAGSATLARSRPAIAAAMENYFASLGGDRPAFTAALARLTGRKARVRVAAR